jgi:hypothetical protein
MKEIKGRSEAVENGLVRLLLDKEALEDPRTYAESYERAGQTRKASAINQLTNYLRSINPDDQSQFIKEKLNPKFHEADREGKRLISEILEQALNEIALHQHDEGSALRLQDLLLALSLALSLAPSSSPFMDAAGRRASSPTGLASFFAMFGGGGGISDRDRIILQDADHVVAEKGIQTMNVETDFMALFKTTDAAKPAQIIQQDVETLTDAMDIVNKKGIDIDSRVGSSIENIIEIAKAPSPPGVASGSRPKAGGGGGAGASNKR